MTIEIHQRWNPEKRKFEDLHCNSYEKLIAQSREEGRVEFLHSVINFISMLADDTKLADVKHEIIHKLGRNRL